MIPPTASECRIQYTQQWLHLLPCMTAIRTWDQWILSGRIALECKAKRQIGATDEFIIKWFRENTTGVVEDLETGRLNTRILLDGKGWYHDIMT